MQKKETKEDAEKKRIEEEQTLREKRQLRIVLVGIGVVVLLMVFWIGISYYTTHFKYKGLNFEVIKDNDMTFYKTALPLYSKVGDMTTGGVVADKLVANYNFYMRNDPKELEKILFDEKKFVLLQNMVINMNESEDDFNCNGDGVIGVANMVKLLEMIEVKVIKDPNATCDESGRYIYLNIKSGTKTRIAKTGTGCYDMIINNCEILKATERFMLETFVKFQESDKTIYINSSKG